MSLKNIRVGRYKQPFRAFVYGVAGVGKSTLFAGSDHPLWLDVERGTGQLSLARYPLGDVPTWEAVQGAMEELAVEMPKSEYRTLVVDTLDALQTACTAYICKRDGKADLDAYGAYGAGGKALAAEFQRFLEKLAVIHAGGINIAILGHAKVGEMRNPSGDNYDHFLPWVSPAIAKSVIGWSDLVGFLVQETFVKKDKGAQKGKGISGDRVLKLQPHATYVAKGRGLPAQVDVPDTDPFGPLGRAIEASFVDDPAQIEADIRAELARIGDIELSVTVENSIKNACGDIGQLLRFKTKLQTKEAKEVQS